MWYTTHSQALEETEEMKVHFLLTRVKFVLAVFQIPQKSGMHEMR